jgi:hypothetical protein
MLPVYLLALFMSYFIGYDAFRVVAILGLVLMAVPFVVVAANKRYLTNRSLREDIDVPT